MKNLKLALATASVLAAGNAAAYAPVWPADGDDAAGVDPAGSVVIWHSGASASNASVQAAVISTFCDPAQAVDVLEDLAGSSANHWAVACIGKSTLSANLASKKILWNKRNEGGSGVGVQPVATSQAIGFMKPSTGGGSNNCPAAATGTRVYGAVTANTWLCSGYTYPSTVSEADPAADAVIRVADIGTADIEADKFTFVENLSSSDLDLNGTRPDAITNSVAGLTQSDLGQLVFGVYGNLLMIQDFQRAQFPAGHPLFSKCNPSGADYLMHFDGVTGAVPITDVNANANREMCMPSISSSEVRSIFGAGRQIRVAGDFQAETAYQSGAFASMVATGGVSDQTLMVCRRVEGSGTQAQFNANLLGYPCDPTGDGSVDTLAPAGEGGLAPNIKENEGSSDLDRCVDDFNDASNASGKNPPVGSPPASLKRWAIGFGSTERNPTLSLNFRYFKLDGFAPTLVNVHAGDYTDYAQQVLLKRSSVTSGAVFDAYTALVPAMSSASAMGALGVTHAFGRGGWLSVPSATNLPTSELSFTTPVNAFRKVSGAGAPNTCALPSAFRPASGAVDVTAAPQNCSSDNNSGDQNCYTP